MVLVDDLDGGRAAETARFALDGVGYEIDLSAEHAAQLRGALAPFVAAARLTVHAGVAAGPRRGGVRVRRESGRPASELSEMRDWARANGFPVGERGRIGREAREAFLATPPQVRAEQAATFAELAELANTAPAGHAPREMPLGVPDQN